MDPYAVLQVTPDAEDTVILAAYRALARRYHPDVAGDLAGRSMADINAAWELLRDPVRRRRYDMQRMSAARDRSTNEVEGAPARRRPANGHQPRREPGAGAAGPPPGRPSGSVLGFGRHLGWSIGEIARVDPGYLEWLEGKPEGRPHLAEIDETLTRTGWRQPRAEPPIGRRGLFRRS